MVDLRVSSNGLQQLISYYSDSENENEDIDESNQRKEPELNIETEEVIDMTQRNIPELEIVTDTEPNDDIYENESVPHKDSYFERCKKCENLLQLCSICVRRKNISEKRSIAKRKQEHQADKMLEISKKRFKPAESGENVNVPVPDVDRGKLNPLTSLL